MEEEKREHDIKMKKMEVEMEQVFEMKVREKKQKLKDSEADVSFVWMWSQVWITTSTSYSAFGCVANICRFLEDFLIVIKTRGCLDDCGVSYSYTNSQTKGLGYTIIIRTYEIYTYEAWIKGLYQHEIDASVYSKNRTFRLDSNL